MSKKYYRKYHLLKRRIKDIIFENAALCDQVAQVQENVSKATEEKKFLLNRLISHDPEYALPVSITEKKVPVRKKSQDKPKSSVVVVSNKPEAPPATLNQQPLEPFTNAEVKIEPQPLMDGTFEVASEQEIPTSSSSVSGQSYAIDNLVIQSLGEIQLNRPSFHTDQWIYPVGFTTNRIYCSMGNPFLKSVYTCTITEVSGNPRFEMSSDADPEVMIVGPSPQFCHSTLLNYLTETHSGLDKLSTVKPDGDWFFGLAHPLVMSLMESMPNFNACSKFQGFAKVENESAIQEKENDPGINFESFMQLVGQDHVDIFGTEIKEELVE